MNNLTKKIWKAGKKPSRGSIVRFVLLSGNEVTGYYGGYERITKDYFLYPSKNDLAKGETTRKFWVGRERVVKGELLKKF